MYYLCWILGGVGCLLVTLRVTHGQGLPPGRVATLLLGMTTAFVAGAALHAALLEAGLGWGTLLASPHLLWRSGFRLPGGVLLALLVSPPLAGLLRIPLRHTLDGIALGFPVTIAIGRVGCWLEGCCFGTITRVPWALTQGAGSPAFENHVRRNLIEASATASLPVHPLALYFIAAAVVNGGVLRALWLHRRAPGEVLLVGLALLGTTSALIETFRELVLVADVPMRQGFWLFVGTAATVGWGVWRSVVAHRLPAAPDGRHGVPSRYG